MPQRPRRQPAPGHACWKRGVEGGAAAQGGAPGRAIDGNIGGGTPGGAPYQPWAAELVKKRMADNSKDNPDAHCLPMGIMQMNRIPIRERSSRRRQKW